LPVSYEVVRGTSPPESHRIMVAADTSEVILPDLTFSGSGALAPAEVVVIRLVPGEGYRLGTESAKRYVLAGSEFARWQAQRFTADELLAGTADAAADADHDGERNLLEFATGGRGRLEARIHGTGPVFEFTRRAGAVVLNDGIADAAGLRYLLETSADLNSWKTSGEDVELVGISPAADPDFERVAVRLKGGARFIRLKVLTAP
jgi:hypothetical protein